MNRSILLLFENSDIRNEVVSYSIGLAKRINADIIMLLLLSLDFDINNGSESDALRLQDFKARGEQLLAPYLEMAEQGDITASGITKVGDPASELLKFLAEDHSFHSVVWGGDQNLFDSKRFKAGEHWISQIKEKLECPLVIPTRK